MPSTASPSPKSQENTFSVFTTTSSSPTIQNFNSSSSVFQDSKACYCSSLHKRHISHHLSRRSTHCCRDVRRRTYKSSNFSSGVPGFSNQLRKVCNNPNPKTRILGLIIDTTSMTLALPIGKIQLIESSAQKLLATKGSISIRLLSRFIGLCTSVKHAVFQAPLHYRSLQFPRNSVLKGRRYSPSLYNLKIHLSPEALTDLRWWANHLQYHSKTPVHTNEPDLIITSDASDLGWGAWCGEKLVQGLWSQEEMFWHINPRELQTANLALKVFSPSQKGQFFHIKLQMNNHAAVSYINHLGGTHSELLCQLSLDLWNWSQSRQIHISAKYIPGIFNKHTDHMLRRLKLTAEWKLNPILFQRMVAVYGIPQ